MNPKPILLATDGSPSAAEATREAIDVARVHGVPLIAVAVDHTSGAMYGGYPYYGYAEIYTDLARVAHEHTIAVLDATAAQAAEAGVDCRTIAASGPTVEEICRVARDENARLIVIGAHGWGPVRRLISGSVSLGVLHEAVCPVLVVRAAPQVEAIAAPAAVAGTV